MGVSEEIYYCNICTVFPLLAMLPTQLGGAHFMLSVQKDTVQGNVFVPHSLQVPVPLFQTI